MNSSIQLHNVSKRFRIGQSVPNLRSLFTSWKNKNGENYHWALRELNFELKPGESLGIIGPNGAGKTTTLKLLSHITYPTSGTITVNGRFSTLIELGAGFHPDLTGRENIYLNGAILGMRKAEIQTRFDEIVEFAGIENYLDTPVKRYSSGMYARLGFSVAAHVNPEILIVDEVLAVGDMAFRKKCYDRMLNLIDNGTTLIFVSHDFAAIQKVCARCIVLYRGNKVYDGTAPNAVAEYSNLLRKAAASKNNKQLEVPASGALSQMVMSHKAIIEKVYMASQTHNDAVYSFTSGEVIRVIVHVTFLSEAKSPIFACTIRSPDGQIVYNFTTQWANISTQDFQANDTVIIEYLIKLNLIAGTYQLGVDLAHNDLSQYYDRMDRAVDFVVTGGNGARGIANLEASFRIAELQHSESE
jgi:lipopolysaccharide transport system ATP-binding protein